MTSVLFLSWLWLQTGAVGQAPPQTPPQTPPPAAPREWIVVLVSPVYLPDGSVRAETVSLPTTGAGLVHMFSRRNLCSPASSGTAEPNDAAFGWRIASQMVSRSESDAVVSLDWRRVWDAGKKVTSGPGGTVQLTLHAGDRIPLDHIANTSPTPECRAVGLGLEARLARTPPAAPPPAASSLPLGATAGGARPVNAELWLTHTSPTDTVQVFHQTVRLSESGGRFSFTPTPVTTTRGALSVELTGTIDRWRAPTGEYLVLTMNRVVNGANLPSAGLSFSTPPAIVAMPGAEEVLSFEMVGNAGRGNAAAARGGGGATFGGAAVSRGTGGASGAGGGTGTAAAQPQISRGGGGGGGGRGGAARGGALMVSAAQLATLLEGHQFSLRVRITPTN